MWRKVKAIAPPIIISSTLSNRLLISGILSETLAPPKMTKNGFYGVSKALEKYSSSFLSKSPAALIGQVTPTIEEWALWAVPKASFTYISNCNKILPKRFNLLLKRSILFLSALILMPSEFLTLPSSSM